MTSQVRIIRIIRIITPTLSGVVHLGVALLLCNLMATDDWRQQTGFFGVVWSDLRCLRRSTTHRALQARLDAIERGLECGDVAVAAEAAQRFQWEALQAQMAGLLSYDTTISFIDNAQAFCQELWAHEPDVTTVPADRGK